MPAYTRDMSLCTLAEACELLKRDRQAVRAMIYKGELRAVAIAGCLHVERDSLNRALAAAGRAAVGPFHRDRVPHATARERQAPDVFQPCQRCRCDTPTVYRLMRSGHVGNLCATCGTCRRGRPYVPAHYLTTIPDVPQLAVKGASHAIAQ